MKNILWLFVFVLVTVKLSTGDVFVAKAGNKIILNCGVNTFTSSLTWYRGPDVVHEKKSRGLPRKGRTDLVPRSKLRLETQLEISRVKEEDAGTFTCNADGKDYQHTLLVVSVSVNPSPELKPGSLASIRCDVKGLNQGSTVQWKRPNATVDHHHFVEIPSVSHSDEGTWVCVITQDGKSHEVEQTIKVQKPTPPPTTTSSPTENIKTDHNPACPSCTTTTQEFPSWVWVTVGVGCFVIFVLMVCVIVLCKRFKRKKKKIQRMKNGRLRPTQYCQCNGLTAAARPQQGRRKEKPSALPLQHGLKESHERQMEERRDRKEREFRGRESEE